MLVNLLVLLVPDMAKDWRTDVTMVDISSKVRFLAWSSSAQLQCHFTPVDRVPSLVFPGLVLFTDDLIVMLVLEALHVFIV